MNDALEMIDYNLEVNLLGADRSSNKKVSAGRRGSFKSKSGMTIDQIERLREVDKIQTLINQKGIKQGTVPVGIKNNAHLNALQVAHGVLQNRYEKLISNYKGEKKKKDRYYKDYKKMKKKYEGKKKDLKKKEAAFKKKVSLLQSEAGGINPIHIVGGAAIGFIAAKMLARKS